MAITHGYLTGSILILLSLVAHGEKMDGIPDKYTTEFDGTDIEPLLNSKRLLNNYVNCLMDRGPCSSVGAELKKHVREALETNCAKCSASQRSKSLRILLHLSEKEPAILKELKAKYDPDGKYEARYAF